jgi:hypothetical protein
MIVLRIPNATLDSGWTPEGMSRVVVEEDDGAAFHLLVKAEWIEEKS